jgi:K+/H+ antiporter YhaU regulatory subunit KhtT
MPDLVVQGQRLPGVGWRYDTPVGEDREQRLAVVVEDRGPRHIMVFDEQSDERLMSLRLSQSDAAGVAALLAVVPAPTADGEAVGGLPSADACDRRGLS